MCLAAVPQVDRQACQRHPPNVSPCGPSAHELRVALGTCYYDIHPDPHGLRRRGHHVVEPVVGLHAEGQRRIGALGEQNHSEMRVFTEGVKDPPVAPLSPGTKEEKSTQAHIAK